MIMPSVWQRLYKREYGIKTTLQDGCKGIFKVTLNNRIIYSNRDIPGDLPAESEIIGVIAMEMQNA